MANIKIRYGNTADIVLLYLVNGQSITEGMCDEMEFYFGGNRYTLTGGEITWSLTDNAYMVSLTQEETFALPSICKYQLRVKIGEKVGGSDVEEIKIGDTISKEVL